MSETNQTSPLTSWQQTQKKLFQAPKGSFCEWAINKIADYELNEITIYHSSVRIVKRIVALAMPVFAAIDTARFIGKAIKKAIEAKPSESFFELKNCAKSLKIFFASLIAIPPAIVYPCNVYRNELLWEQLMDKQNQKAIFDKINDKIAAAVRDKTDKREAALAAINEICCSLIAAPKMREEFRTFVSKLPIQADALEDHQDSLQLRDYVQLISLFSIQMAHQSIADAESLNDFFKIALEVSSLRRPELRINMFAHLVESIRTPGRKLHANMAKQKDNNVRTDLLPALFEASQIVSSLSLSDEKKTALFERINTLCDHKSLRDKTKMLEVIDFFAKLSSVNVEPSAKEKILLYVIETHEKSQVEEAKPKPDAAISKNEAKRIRKLEAQQKAPKLSRRERKRAAKQAKNNPRKDKPIAAPAKTGRPVKEPPQIHQPAAKNVEKTLEAIKTANILMSLKKSDLIEACLQDKNKEDKNILISLFKTVYDVDLTADQIAKVQSSVRDISALLQFHLRLKELSGDEKVKALEANKKCLKWIANGKYDQKRHSIKNNPHLKTIFENYPDLEKPWQEAPSMKIKDLMPSYEGPYKDFEIKETKDPSDILLIGVEARNCLDLRGRLYRVKGLLGFLLDGKTHEIVITDPKGKIISQAELQLMWDEKQKRPVLLLEEICSSVDRNDPANKTLNNAIVAYAKKRAETLGLDLVSRLYEKDGLWVYPQYSQGKSYLYKNANPYDGIVSSLGTSSPIDYANCFLDTTNGPYELLRTDVQLLQQSFKKLMDTFQIRINNQDFIWTKNSLKSMLVNLRNALKDYHWIKRDLSVTRANIIEQAIWLLLKPFEKLRKSLFNINHEKAKAILTKLAPLVEKDPTIKELYKEAVTNFESIAPNHTLNGNKISVTIASKKLVKSNQGTTTGFTNLNALSSVFNKIKQEAPASIALNEHSITRLVRGGNCTALSLDFANEFAVQGLDKIADFDVLTKKVANMAEKYIKGSDASAFKNRQAAFNCIEIKPNHLKDNVNQLAQDKVQAFLNYSSFNIKNASKTFNILKDTKSSLQETLNSLPNGLHFLRVIKPLNNEKLEEHGHSMIVFKHPSGFLFYDPNCGVEVVPNKDISTVIFDSLALNYARFEVSEARFYQIEKEEPEVSAKSHFSKLSPTEVMKAHDEASQKKGGLIPLLKHSPFDPKTTIWPTMEGIGLLADYLAQKNELDGLFVCQNMKDFTKRLVEIDSSPQDRREVLIIPPYRHNATCDKKDLSKCTDETHQNHDHHSQHKVSVLIEKKEGKTKICVVDSTNGDKLDLPKTYLDKGNVFRCSELIHAYIREAKLENAEYYYTTVIRQNSRTGGCQIFALRDGVALLRMKDFFEQIEQHGQISKTEHDGTLDSPHYIKNLPPEFMKLIQSMKALAAYKTTNAEGKHGYDLMRKLGKKQRTLAESVDQHTRLQNGKPINKHIDDRDAKYNSYILERMQKLSKEEIEKRIARRMVA